MGGGEGGGAAWVAAARVVVTVVVARVVVRVAAVRVVVALGAVTAEAVQAVEGLAVVMVAATWAEAKETGVEGTVAAETVAEQLVGCLEASAVAAVRAVVHFSQRQVDCTRPSAQSHCLKMGN